MRVGKAWDGIKLAFEFLVLTATRSAEVRLATWQEIDLVSMVWTIPQERMKAKREPRIPLSKRAVEVLRAAEQLRPSPQPHELVFTGVRGRRIDASVVSKMIAQARDRRGPARLPVVIPGLGVGADGPPPGGCRSGPGAHRAGPDRGRVRAVGPVRAPPAPDGRLGGLPEGAAGAGGDAGAVTGWQDGRLLMGEMSTAESLPAVIGATVGTVFGIWRIVESTRGGIEKSIQENHELDQRGRRRLCAMLE